MSVSVSNVPPWKRALLEKKRNNDEGERGYSTKEEGDRMSSLPSWKRDILSKKQHTKNSVIFLGENNSVRAESGVSDNIVENTSAISIKHQNSVEDPVKEAMVRKENGDTKLQENPWLRADSSHTKKKVAHRLSDSVIDRRSNHSGSNNSCSETDGNHATQNSHAVINNEEEVAYGKGFVHKLLKKFSLMSYKDEEETHTLQSSIKGRISRSTENLLDPKIDYSSRNFSPQGRNNESLSPRSQTFSQSSDSLPPSPRILLDGSGGTNIENHKMGFEDKAGITNSEVFTSDHGSTSEDSLSPTVVAICTDITDNSELPRRNTVASARSVFENFASHSDTRGQSIGPRSPRSPRTNSVHSLIAVDTLSSTNDDQASFKTIHEEKSEAGFKTIHEEKSEKLPVSPEHSSTKTVILSPKDNRDTSQVSRSKFFPGKLQGSLHKNVPKNVSQEGSVDRYSNNGMDITVDRKGDLTETSEQTSDKTGVLIKPGQYSKSDNIVNGHINGDTSRKKTDGSHKKRKAPIPMKISPEVHVDNKKYVTSVLVDNSKTTIKNVPPKPDNVSSVMVTSLPQKQPEVKNRNISDAQNQNKVVKRNDTKRQNLSLNLGKAEPENLITSEASKSTKVEEPRIPIKLNANHKAKFKVPTSNGPGSLLIRPASNMVQGKDAQFVNIKFKYHDIKTGDFAPAKKKPAYYDEYSDDSDEEVLVTNIDDVIEGRDQASRVQRDANSNVPMKTKMKKYDFVGQGVLLSKSTLKTRTTKLAIRFNDHAISVYEYPSHQYLLDTMPPEAGDFDHPDTMYNETSTPSDEDIPDMEGPSTTLKANPALSSGSSSMSDYQSKMAVEFHFGMDPIQQNGGSTPSQTVAATRAASNAVRPADEDDTVQWSESKTSDLLF